MVGIHQQSLRRGSPLPLRHIASAPSKVNHFNTAASVDLGLLMSPPGGAIAGGLGALGPPGGLGGSGGGGGYGFNGYGGAHGHLIDPLRNSTPAVLGGAGSLLFQQFDRSNGRDGEDDDEDDDDDNDRGDDSEVAT